MHHGRSSVRNKAQQIWLSIENKAATVVSFFCVHLLHSATLRVRDKAEEMKRSSEIQADTVEERIKKCSNVCQQ